jgi:hypothetical protein
MRNQMTIFLIRLTAAIAAGTALYELYPDLGLRNLDNITTAFRYKEWWLLAWVPLGFLLSPVIPVAKLTAAIGLVRFQPWAWRAAIIPLMVDLLIRLTEAINFAVQCYRFRYRDFHIPKGTIVGHAISMWPLYIIGFLCAFAILLLLRPSVKRQFEKIDDDIA